MMAAMMSLHALAVDIMLPALPAIGRAFAVADDNQLQWVITLFVLGTGTGQLFYGPLSDRFGRRRILIFAITLNVVMSFVASFASSLSLLLWARIAQGASIAATSVVTRSVVRDLYAGNSMARVMSLIFLVFLTTPVLAPSIGQLLLHVMDWRGLFRVLGLYGAAIALWAWFRLPETLAVAHRRPLNVAHLGEAARYVLSHPISILYTLASALLFGSLLAYVSTMPQIFAIGFKAPHLMALTFAICAGTMGLASFLNSRIVERVGMHRVSHAGLLSFISVTAIHSAVALSGHETLVFFAILQALTMGTFGLAMSNFSAIAMQPMGAIAGSAASIQGVLSTIGGALVASLIGQQWSGAVAFLPVGAFSCGALALLCVLVAEKRVLFVKRH